MRNQMDQFIADVKALTKQKPPFNDAFVFRAINVLGTAVTLLEGMLEIVKKNKIQIDIMTAEITKLNEQIAELESSDKEDRTQEKHERNQAIVDDYNGGMSRTNLAAKYEVSLPRISAILKRAGVDARTA
jgi:hypothetical protein